MRATRLRVMSGREIAWRLQSGARVRSERISTAIRQPRWTRSALRRALAPGVIRSPLPSDNADSRWMDVHAALVHRLQRRPARFVIDPRSAPALRDAILTRWPGAADDAARRAGEIRAGRYDLLGYRGLSFGSASAGDAAIDWHLDPVHGRRAPMRFWADVAYLDPAHGDHKIIWEINRHQHFLVLGRALWLAQDPRCRQEILRQLASWLEANPPLVGINWASMLEVAFRSISWVCALHLLLGDERAADEAPWLVDLLVALDRQLVHVERHLSYYFSPNTHLTGEALALYVAGRALPELTASPRWARLGRSVLLAEIDRQISPDGGHVERSTHYHRYTLDFYLLALLVARRTGDAAGAAPFTDAVSRLAPFMRAMTDDRGHMPLIGDDDGGMLWPFKGPTHDDARASLALAAAVLDRPDLSPWETPEEVYWLAWSTGRCPGLDRPKGLLPTSPATRSAAFHESGYVVIRDESRLHLVFDAGPHGYLNGGHAHADALSITVTMGGRPLLIDPGTATYTMDARLRDRLRATASHNTVTIDGRSSAQPAGPFHWMSRADARLGAWRDNPRFAWAEAWHDAYAGTRHRRSIVRAAGGLLIADELIGSTQLRAETHWQFDPSWQVEDAGGCRLRARHADGTTVWLACDAEEVRLVRGEPGGAGWYSPSYGVLHPTWSACCARAGRAPLVLFTWVGASDDGSSLRPCAIDARSPGPAIAVGLTHGTLDTTFVLRPGHDADRSDRSCTAGGYRTDGRLLVASSRDGRLVALDLADATYAIAEPDGTLSVSAGERMTDLHLAFEDDRLECWTSSPPSRFELRGRALTAIRHARMNGHPLSVVPSAAGSTLVIQRIEQQAV